jgi:succinate dehydrogenase hydrophobic anchor subunit
VPGFSPADLQENAEKPAKRLLSPVLFHMKKFLFASFSALFMLEEHRMLGLRVSIEDHHRYEDHAKNTKPTISF